LDRRAEFLSGIPVRTELPKPDYARNMRIVGYSDQGGRPDGVQVMVHRGHAYVGHMFSKGFSIIDVRDAANPRAVNYIAAPPGTWNIHLQTHDDLLLVINAKDMFAAPEFADERAYYKGQLGKVVGTADAKPASRDWTAGLAVYDIGKPAHPRRIGFMALEGGGIHRVWYAGGRWAYASALIDGFTDYIFITIDMADPQNPTEAGRWWIRGMNQAAGEAPDWPATSRFGLHHAIVHGDTAYAAWRDAGMVVIDVSDRTRPTLISHRDGAPPFGGGTHNCLPLPDRDLLVVLDEAVLDNQEDGVKHIWVLENSDQSRPSIVSSFPQPSEANYRSKGGHFGPHNIHENRPGTFVNSDLIFATYQNAGVRVFDIRNALRPHEVGGLVPPAPMRMMDHRPNRARIIQSADVFVDSARLIYLTDYNAGLFILEFTG
jgi:hypothetical protein